MNQLPALSRRVGWFAALATVCFLSYVVRQAERRSGDQQVSSDEDWQINPDDGRRFKAELIRHIQSASRIVVTEHANFTDFWTRTGTLEPKEIVYGTITLDATQKARLLAAVSAMDDQTMSQFPGCIFEPHHTIAFYNDESKTSSVRICFRCNEVVWDGTKRTPPQDVCTHIRGFIESIGFTPSRDWRALAQGDQLELPRAIHQSGR